MDAAAEEALLGELFDEDDFGVDEDGGLAVLVGDGDFDEGLLVVLLAALEAQAAFRHVLAGDDFVAALGMADASGVGDFDARVLTAIGGRRGGSCGCKGSWGRHGEDGGLRLGGSVRNRLADGGGVRGAGAGGIGAGRVKVG